MTPLPVHIERNDQLANFFGVEELVLVREDLLSHGGGKKRRALESKKEELSQYHNIHILSYAGSHTALTLSRLLPDVKIHLYGTHYGGGAYEETMVNILNTQKNITQKTGSSLAMSLDFNLHKLKLGAEHHFMKVGGSVNADPSTLDAIDEVIAERGQDFHHIAAVASGDLLKSIQSRTNRVTGVLTQPLGIRLFKALSLKNVTGLTKASLHKRIEIMKEIRDLTGTLWDPIFMGPVFTYLNKQRNLPQKICIWVTCPGGIDWVSSA